MLNLFLNFLLTALLYMFYPVITVCTKKGKDFYTQPELRNTAIINAVLVKITIIILTYPTVGSFAPTVFWGYVSYKIMMKYLLKPELPEPEPPVQEQEQPPEPIPATPEKVKVKPVKVNRAKTTTSASPQPTPQSKPVPATQTPPQSTPEPEPVSTPRKKSDSGIMYLIMTFILFIILIFGFGGSTDKTFPILGTENFVVHHSELSLSIKEISEAKTSDIKIYFYDNAETWHIFEDCPIIKRTDDKDIYYVYWKDLWPYIPDRNKACTVCKTAIGPVAKNK